MGTLINYFGYGANSLSDRLEKILGIIPQGGVGAIISQHDLAYQSLDQIPEPAKNILNSVWGKEFFAYTILPGQGFVSGLLWQLTPEEFQDLKKWEFCGTWREMIPVEITTSEGKKMSGFTDRALNYQNYIEKIDSLSHPPDLNLGKIIFTERESSLTTLQVSEKLDLIRLAIKNLQQNVQP